MLALVGLFTATMSTTLCMIPEILAMRTDAEMWCDGAIECFDGCDICGSKMCELHAEVANVTCECDFWMCYAYCAKQTCEDPVVAAGGAQRCAAAMLIPDVGGSIQMAVEANNQWRNHSQFAQNGSRDSAGSDCAGNRFPAFPGGLWGPRGRVTHRPSCSENQKSPLVLCPRPVHRKLPPPVRCVNGLEEVRKSCASPATVRLAGS